MPSNPITIEVIRTDHAPGIPNEWVVKQGDEHHTHHRDIDGALLMLKAMMQVIEKDQVHR